ncbi:Hypothetical protein I595_325 [Croceitalea dokdonensis DOKDO 023]|uniref:Uncharacterized protein n=1 Tax=Croceitalea dokdonensis DOKDO 023 TaxID=1300341 RepID=A0A0P7AIJ9_9FLAO|nr:hypothetical protein [Croceitalea dokdonensis]KPM33422.1 Hypothetical protein I595_325 [Croceitalea dokdonensis DOKDO 023]
MELNIKRNISLAYINELNTRVDESDTKIKIRLPKNIKNASFGVIPSFIQFFATAIRKEKCSHLILPFSTKEELAKYIEVEYVYPFTVLAWNLKIIDDSEYNLKDRLTSISQNYFSRLEFLKVKTLRSLPLYSFDHDISKRGLSRYFYDNNYKLIYLDQLEFNLYPIFKKLSLAHNVQDSRNTLAPILESLTEIIYELFKNTHEHGRSKVKGGFYFPNVRNVTLRTIRRKRSAYLEDTELPESVKEYFKNNLPLTEKSDFIMLEISVLDSGPGLVCRVSNTENLSNYSLDEELSLTKECLLKHKTSSNAYLAKIKGEGLDKVMQLLDKKGFLRIRTGRLDLFRNFISDPYLATKDFSRIVLKDYFNNDNNFIEHPQVSGTLHTFYYPIGSP